MIRLNALEKLILRIGTIFNFTNNKKIINKNSPNYGNQTIAEKIINKTDLTNKNTADIRTVEIKKTTDREYSTTAKYSDGTLVEGFEGYWYGWQLVPRGPLWTYLGKSKKVDLGKSRYSSISTWVFKQEDDKNVDKNPHAEINIGDRAWM